MNNQKTHTQFPSRYNISEKVSLDFFPNKPIEGCIIKSVKFSESKVKYDILIPVKEPVFGEESFFTLIENVDSIFVKDIN